jgi:hypothetical protein
MSTEKDIKVRSGAWHILQQEETEQLYKALEKKFNQTMNTMIKGSSITSVSIDEYDNWRREYFGTGIVEDETITYTNPSVDTTNIIEKFYMSYDEAEDEKETPTSIVEFYSLKELLECEPDSCFDTGGYLFRNKEEKENGEDYISPDDLQFLGDTVLLSDENLECIPKWTIKRNLGR